MAASRSVSTRAFVKDAKKKFGITDKVARSLRREMQDRLGRTVRAVDLKRHPRITKQELEDALAPRVFPAEEIKLPRPDFLEPRDLDFVDIVIEGDFSEMDTP